jgi:glycosyltransferase
MKISLITATFNSAKTIGTTIESILQQEYSNIEHLILDGGSNDKTIEILSAYQKKHPNIIVYSEKDNGIYDALNKGISKATGDIIGFVHSDDLLPTPQTLTHIVNTFKTQECDGVYGDLKYVKQDNTQQVVRYWKSKVYTPKLLNQGWMPPHPTLFLKREIYKDIGNFDLSYKIASDYEFMVRLFLQKKYTLSYLPETLILMRVGGASNKSLRNIIQKSKEDYRVIKKHHLNGLLTLFSKNILKLNQFFKK